MRPFQQLRDSLRQLATVGAQFVDALPRDMLQDSLSARQKGYQNTSAIVSPAGAMHVAVCFQPIHQFHGTVMFQRQTFRERSDGGLLAFRQSANCQQQQILLRFESRGSSNRVPFAQELANSTAELCQGTIFPGCNLRLHFLSISSCDTLLPDTCYLAFREVPSDNQ
jgi:hypothetical protein